MQLGLQASEAQHARKCISTRAVLKLSSCRPWGGGGWGDSRGVLEGWQEGLAGLAKGSLKSVVGNGKQGVKKDCQIAFSKFVHLGSREDTESCVGHQHHRSVAHDPYPPAYLPSLTSVPQSLEPLPPPPSPLSPCMYPTQGCGCSWASEMTGCQVHVH